MGDLGENVRSFCALLRRGESLAALERFYGAEVCVFENRTLARAGRKQCLEYEREALSRASTPPRFAIHRVAVNEVDQVAFLEYTVRFSDASGRPFRLEEVAVQVWEGDRIVQERFYYEGMVDEGEGGTGDATPA